MRRLHATVAGIATFAALLVGAPAATAAPMASADPGDARPAVRADVPYRTPLADTGPSQLAAADANGYFYAYEHAHFTGRWCAWEGYAKNWGNPGGAGTGGQWGCNHDDGFDNIATSVWNNGYYTPPVSAVWMFRDTFYGGGAWMCLDAGDYWADFTLGWERFSDGGAADNAISSHYWSVTCT
ncbi:hypothetical protein WEI85_33860 [Actinomycetes bacterium KLBMP 9797]